jgi:hypothetical protein
MMPTKCLHVTGVMWTGGQRASLAGRATRTTLHVLRDPLHQLLSNNQQPSAEAVACTFHCWASQCALLGQQARRENEGTTLWYCAAMWTVCFLPVGTCVSNSGGSSVGKGQELLPPQFDLKLYLCQVPAVNPLCPSDSPILKHTSWDTQGCDTH